jgi:hypothetical protein
VGVIARVLIVVALVAAPFVGASLWLDTRGETAVGTVTRKDEMIGIEHQPTGGWYLRRSLVLQVPSLWSGFRPSVWVDSAEFDRIRLGDQVALRYVSCCPIFARLASHSTRDAVWEAARELGSDPLLDWCAIGLVAFVLAARIGSVVVFATGAGWLGVALAFLFPARPPGAAAGVETTARVSGVSLVEDSPRPSGRRYSNSITTHPERLNVPYDVVQLRFAPAASPDSVLAVDEVDAASVPSLAPGAVVRVRYPPAAPGQAMLVDATRTFRQRNRFHFLFLVLGWAGIGTAAGLAWCLRGRRRAAAAA